MVTTMRSVVRERIVDHVWVGEGGAEIIFIIPSNGWSPSARFMSVDVS